MQKRWRWICMFLVVVAVAGLACHKRSSKKKKPPPSEGASVRINGSVVTFAIVDHFYDTVFGEIVINMWSSSPTGWDIYIFAAGPDANPGCVNSCDDFVFIEVYDPFGDVYLEDFCFYDVYQCFSSYSTTLGTFTIGTFSADVENLFPPWDVLDLTGGSFTAVRN
ncbi:MAG: hypothetical protein O7H41_05585 [Planctomycetota bacterium]|nr:hypothetical protein [Planctomycetota bacterium]